MRGLHPDTVFDSFRAEFLNTNLPAGQSTQVFFTTPAKQAGLIRTVAWQYTGTITNVHITGYLTRGASDYVICHQFTHVTTQVYAFTMNVPVFDGDTIKVIVLGATAGNDLAGWVTGVRTK